jgi:hypothetical protein
MEMDYILLKACSPRNGVIWEWAIGGWLASSIADHASTCCSSALGPQSRTILADLLIDILYHLGEIRLTISSVRSTGSVS